MPGARSAFGGNLPSKNTLQLFYIFLTKAIDNVVNNSYYLLDITVTVPERRYMNRIKEYRNKRGISQSELARRIGVSVPTVSRYESNDAEKSRNPRKGTMMRISNALQVGLDRLWPRQGGDE